MNIDELVEREEARLAATSPYLRRAFGMDVRQLSKEEAMELSGKAAACAECGTAIEKGRLCRACRGRRIQKGWEKRRAAQRAEAQRATGAAHEAAPLQQVLQERGSVYGPPADHHGRVAEAYRAVTGDGLVEDALDVEMLWIVDKLVRFDQSGKSHEDSLVDVQGYAACALEVVRGEHGDWASSRRGGGCASSPTR